jgi:hypothetical protein
MLRSASNHYRRSALLARSAANAAGRAPNALALAATVVTHQAAQARMSEQAVADMLAEQGVDVTPAGSLQPLAFTTDAKMLAQMVGPNTNVPRLVESLVQDAGRSAESVATASRPQVGHVRYLSPPSCSRCAVLAGRAYRYSDGFKRHTNCDCTMIPALEAAAPGLVSDPTDLMRQGKVTGLSKADMQAVADGADLSKVVNVRRYESGLRESGRVLARAGKLTPEGIYRLASNQAAAVAMLRRFGYIT